MSRLFQGSVTSDALTTGANIGGPTSLTYFCWYRQTKSDPVNTGGSLMGNWGAASNNYNTYLYTGNPHTINVAQLDSGLTGRGGTVNQAAPPRRDGWECAGYSWLASSMKIFGNGVIVPQANPGASIANKTSNILIGARQDNLVFFNGWIAQAAIWLSASATDAFLTNEEMQALMRGVSPRLIRPGRLWGYWPMVGDSLKDLSGNQRHLTVSSGRPTGSSVEPFVDVPLVPRRLRGFVAASAPSADFTATPLTGTAPLLVTFTDTSTNTPTSWLWDFGDGATSTSQNPTHTYTVGGTYTVALTATNAAGSNTRTRTAYVAVTETIVYATGGAITVT